MLTNDLNFIIASNRIWLAMILYHSTIIIKLRLCINTPKLGQNGHFADIISNYLCENCFTLIQMSQAYDPGGPINNASAALVQIKVSNVIVLHEEEFQLRVSGHWGEIIRWQKHVDVSA